MSHQSYDHGSNGHNRDHNCAANNNGQEGMAIILQQTLKLMGHQSGGRDTFARLHRNFHMRDPYECAPY